MVASNRSAVHEASVTCVMCVALRAAPSRKALEPQTAPRTAAERSRSSGERLAPFGPMRAAPKKGQATRILTGLAALIVSACGQSSTGDHPLPVTTVAVDYGPPPGATNPAVTQATIGTTICVSGWTATVRPSTSFTNALKAAQIKARHLPGAIAGYEEDHWIPLELGGAPSDPRNLWPEPRRGPHASAAAKDRAENRLKAAVCAGSLSLVDAQVQITNPEGWQ